MQTFLPFSSFELSSQCLDRQRLGKQRVECMQLLNAIINPTVKGWVNHPCTKMWRATPSALLSYTVTVCQEWVRRGYKDTVEQKVLDMAANNPNVFSDLDCVQRVIGSQVIHQNGTDTIMEIGPVVTQVRYSIEPWWLGDDSFHLSHKSNLVRKNPGHYRRFFPDVSDSLAYRWPQDDGTFSP